MKTILLFYFTCCLTLSAQFKPIPAKEVIVKDVYHTITIEDPYRYMENLEDPEVIRWMRENSNFARIALNEIPERDKIIQKLKELDQRKGYSVKNIHITENNTYLYLKRLAHEENPKLYLREGFKGTEKLLFDPNNYKKETQKNYTISNFYPNASGNKIALEIAPNGSENAELLILNSEGKLYPEIIDRCWFASVSWLADDNSFFYLRTNSNDVTNKDRLLNSKAFFHKLGTDSTHDIEIFSNKTNPELGIEPNEFPVLAYHKPSNKLIAYILTVDRRIKAYISNTQMNILPKKWTKICEKEDEVYDLSLDEKDMYLMTFKNAPNFKILRMPIEKLDLHTAETFIPESKSTPIDNFKVTKNYLFYSVIENGVTCKIFKKDKSQQHTTEIQLPFKAGSATIQNINEVNDAFWITLSGWTSPTRRYTYDSTTDKLTEENLHKIVDYPEFKNMMSEEIMVTSHDGVLVPVSIIYDKKLKKDGNNRVLMMGYGAYGISSSPFFSPQFVLNYCRYGGVFIVPHVRGGGELGEKWHQAGFKETKPNTWKDLIATAEYLIKENITTPNKIAITGGSAGGILIGRALTERPDLFAAAIPEVGCMNPLRMENSPNGPGNIPEFGTVSDEKEFHALLAMDSFHHIQKGVKYPATLITAGFNDPRVIAWQPAKFAARLQNANISNSPILFFTDFEAGHGIGDSTSKQFESIADLHTFAYQYTGHPKFKPLKKLAKF